MYPEKFIRDNVAPFLRLSIVIVIVIDRIVVGDLQDDADHDLFRKVSFTSFIESFVTTETYFY